MKLTFGESLPASGIDLFGDKRLEVCLSAKRALAEFGVTEDVFPDEEISRAEDGIIDVCLDAVQINREDITSALKRVNEKMGTDYELAE